MLVVAGLSTRRAGGTGEHRRPKISGTAAVGDADRIDGHLDGATTPVHLSLDALQRAGQPAQHQRSRHVLPAPQRNLGDTVRPRDREERRQLDDGDLSNRPSAKATTPATANGCPTSGTGTLDVGNVSPPARLLIDGQSVSPPTITRTPGDVTVRFHVSACTGRSISGALVLAEAIPFSQFSIPPETPTGADGWATMTMHQDRFFPASPRQQLLAVVVATGLTTLLGGISTRRLVSFPVNLHS